MFRPSFKGTIFLCLGGGVIALLLFLLLFRQEDVRSFPNLPVGAYIGHAYGLRSTRRDSATLYIERIKDNDTLLFVVFDQGWKPQAISLKPLQRSLANNSRLREDTLFEPITLDHEKKKFVFVGVQRKQDEFSGNVYEGDDNRGGWSLRPTNMQELEQGTAALGAGGEDVKTWMSAKVQNIILKMQIEQTVDTNKRKQEKLEKLQTFIANEDLLRQKARAERDKVAKETHEATKEREKHADAIAHLVDELDLLARITKRGKAVTLARKVANRENKWYLAHWKTEEDTSGLEEFGGQSLEVDLAKLDVAYRRANEIRSLTREIAEHEQRIRELEALRDNSESLPSQPAQRLEPERSKPIKPELRKEKKREESFWGKIFG